MRTPSACPACSASLAPHPDSRAAWGCPSCHGVLLALSRLRQQIDEEHAFDLWRRAALARTSETRSCPSCSHPLRVWQQSIEGEAVELDACRSCELLWFDRGEIERVRALVEPVKRSASSDWADGTGELVGEAVGMCLDFVFSLADG